MLSAQFTVEFVFDLREVCVGLAWYSDRLRLVSSGVCLDEVLQIVIVDIICGR